MERKIKNYDFYRKRSVITTVISFSTLAVGGGMLAYFLLSTDVRPIAPGIVFYAAISLCFIGFISVFIGMNYDEKCNIEINKVVEKRRIDDFNHIIELISQKRTEEAITALNQWVKKISLFKKTLM